jgi:hypothetical protein
MNSCHRLPAVGIRQGMDLKGALNSAPQRRASTATSPAPTSHTSLRNTHGYTEPKLRRCRNHRGPTREEAQGREQCRSGDRSSRSFAGRYDLTNDRCPLEAAFDAAPRRKTEVGRNATLAETHAQHQIRSCDDRQCQSIRSLLTIHRRLLTPKIDVIAQVKQRRESIRTHAQGQADVGVDRIALAHTREASRGILLRARD